MKRTFLNTILATLGMNILFPLICYMFFGIIYVIKPFDIRYLIITSAILIFVLLNSYVLIRFSRNGVLKYDIDDLLSSDFLNNKYAELLFAVAIIVNIVKQVLVGGFAGIITGAGNGGAISYLQLFLNIHVLHFIVLLKQYKNKNIKGIIIWESLYLVTTLFSASRSGVFWIVFFNISIVLSLKISRKLKKTIITLMMVAIIASPVLFAITTNARESVKHTSTEIAQTIVARLSYLEVASIEMDQYSNDTYDKQIFHDKYGVDNQIKQCINSVIPGSVFKDDVQPNQYWRAVFSGWTLDDAKLYYTSIYMILPMYFVYKFGLILGILISVCFIYVLYRVIGKVKDPTIATFLSCFLFYTLFQYFDWCYHFQDIFGIVLTLWFVNVLGGNFGRVRFVVTHQKRK